MVDIYRMAGCGGHLAGHASDLCGQRAVDMSRNHAHGARMRFQTVHQRRAVSQIVSIHGCNTRVHPGVMGRYDHGLRSNLSQSRVQKGKPFLAQLPMMGAFQKRIETDQRKRTKVVVPLDGAGSRHPGCSRKTCTHCLTLIVVARNCKPRQFETRHDRVKLRVFLRCAMIRQVPCHNHAIHLTQHRQFSIECRDGGCQCLGGVGLTADKGIFGDDVGVGDLNKAGHLCDFFISWQGEDRLRRDGKAHGVARTGGI